MKKILLFAPSITGHNIEYIGHLYQKLKSDNVPSIILTSSNICNDVLTPTNSIKFEIISILEQLQSIEDWALYLNNICIKKKVSHILFMHLDILLIPKFCSINKSCTISAIYFEHFVRYNIFSSFRYWARGIKYISPIVYNNLVKEIFILNDKAGTSLLNNIYLPYRKFKFLSDPIDSSITSNDENIETNIKKLNNILSESKIITCIGSLDSRKNTTGVIKSLKFIPPNILDKIVLIIYGQAGASEDERIIHEISCFSNILPSFRIIYHNARLSSKQFNDIIFQTDILLMPYIGHVGSSGILGHAVKYNKIVIGSKNGLISHLVNKYRLGYLVNPLNSKQIAKAITKSIDSQPTIKGRIQYLKEFNPTSLNFSETILSSFLKA